MQTTRKGNWYEIIIPVSWHGLTLNELFQNIWKAPKKSIHQFRMGQGIKVNGQTPLWNKELTQGDRLQLSLFDPGTPSLVPAYHDIDVLYEDDHVLILNKPAGMDTHPNGPEQSDTLANAALYHLQCQGELLVPRHIHRLDRDTTGAVLFAKTALAGGILDKMLEEREIKRTYLALAEGCIQKKKGTINEPIGRDRHDQTRRRVSKTGQHAVTHYQVLEYRKQEDLTLVKVRLDTGRTHQIRVHFSHIGHPLAGDRLYGGSGLFHRQALHAAHIELLHPFTREKISCHAPFLDKKPIFKEVPAWTP